MSLPHAASNEACFFVGQLLLFFMSAGLHWRAMKAAERAEYAARKTELTIDPLDAEAKGRSLLSAMEKASESLGLYISREKDPRTCAACGCPWAVHIYPNDCVTALRKKRMGQ